MNLKRLAIITFTTYALCALWAITGVKDTTETTRTLPVPQTVSLGMLTPQQLKDRAEDLLATTTTTSTTTTTTTQPSTTVVPVPAETKCQEWFPTAISVGWPNNPETLEKLGRLLWKETRCQNVSYTHPQFNGHDHGVAQINQVHRKYVEQLFDMPMEESMSDPTLNLRFAFLLYSDIAETGGCGWKPWSLC
ncbi:hypothetical protein UFOVP1511_16 [uncultured Caudovirales phage]|uniref:Transglycosylase SLT domain 1 n=1 Tax=uncultured Caudovirales phage TaxID=2100421 RepID=A0A6J7XAJ8_9CAUD|nr:hypothetical protein UFOVP871_16 [uncultured Caudovirales phage]CAB4195004.1 hypothetical protein UFOVP1280_16 [uncultured Caudovirales phage]CAB4223233.1 hypothetical protein UFOVP1663_16 [uncultured Caudovirales phage]CAB5226722.1 hypothetical protein UFOVP1511_16 [uncultured Caudovirales phage]